MLVRSNNRLASMVAGLTILSTVIAGFFTGGALAVRGGIKAARNSAIMCGCFLAVIEGVGIGFQRMMAENTRLDVSSTTTLLPSELSRPAPETLLMKPVL